MLKWCGRASIQANMGDWRKLGGRGEGRREKAGSERRREKRKLGGEAAEGERKKEIERRGTDPSEQRGMESTKEGERKNKSRKERIQEERMMKGKGKE